MTRLAALLALVPTTVLAHPGHGHTDPASWRHYVTEPVHLAALAATAAVAIVAGVIWRARLRSRLP